MKIQDQLMNLGVGDDHLPEKVRQRQPLWNETLPLGLKTHLLVLGKFPIAIVQPLHDSIYLH